MPKIKTHKGTAKVVKNVKMILKLDVQEVVTILVIKPTSANRKNRKRI